MTRTPDNDYDIVKIYGRYEKKPTLRSVALHFNWNSHVFAAWFNRNWKIEMNPVFINKKTGERVQKEKISSN